jgi:hypothetical protein
MIAPLPLEIRARIEAIFAQPVLTTRQFLLLDILRQVSEQGKAEKRSSRRRGKGRSG